jgi:thioredoxin 1
MTIQDVMFVKDCNDIMITSRSNLVVIDFYTDWCGPCRAIAPTYSELSTQHKNIRFYKINGESDAVEPFATHVKAYPTFLFIKDEEVVDKLVGGNPDNLKRKIAELAVKFS